MRNRRFVVDLLSILKYFFYWALFSLVACVLKTIVMFGINNSTFHRVGGSIITLSEVHNTGAAFSLFSKQPELITIASFIAVVVITVIVLISSKKLSNSSVFSMALLSSGITMNVVDRIYQGYVTDYIHLNFIENFPVFNVPDIMIVFGAIGLIFSVLAKN